MDVELKTKVVGVTFGERQEIIGRMSERDELDLIPEPENPYDPNAIMVRNKAGEQIGYLSRELASDLVDEIVDGRLKSARVENITGGKEKQSYGMNISITIERRD